MTLNANAPSFVMPVTFDDEGKPYAKEELGACSTAAPSPAMTASSPPFSPWDSPSQEPFSWQSLLRGPPPFALPAAEEEEAAPKPKPVGFQIAGLNSLQSSLASVLAKHIPADKIAPRSRSGSWELSGIAPPPGLEPPPGLDDAPSTPESDKAQVEVPASLPANCTTVMLRNIPNKYSREKLAAQLQEDGFRGDMDFLYLPIDFRNKCNVGYAFVSFRSPEACARFASQYHNRSATDKLPGFKSKKICEVSEARCQGREENVRRLQNSQVMQQLAGRPDWLPLLFDGEGKAEDFPMPKGKAEAVPVAKEEGSKGRSSRRRGQ